MGEVGRVLISAQSLLSVWFITVPANKFHSDIVCQVTESHNLTLTVEFLASYT